MLLVVTTTWLGGLTVGERSIRTRTIEIPLPATTVEAWGTGYAQGFNDSRDLCIQVLQEQREMMIEQMEPTPPGWSPAETTDSGTDRHGVALPGLGGPTLP